MENQKADIQPKEDVVLDRTLRPRNFEEFIGQDHIKENLHIFIDAAKKRREPLEHILLYGGPGLGKTSLAHLIAQEVGGSLRTTTGPAIEKVGDLASILTNLESGDILFIDEAHRLNKLVEEILYPALENYKLNLIIGRGPSARTLELDLAPFTLIAATTRVSLLSSPLRSRFGVTFRLDYYTIQDIKKILRRSSELLTIPIEDDALNFIAQCCRFTPRVANRLLKRVRDVAQVRGQGIITPQLARDALLLFKVDSLGLEDGDRKILTTLIHKFSGGPVGLQTLAAASAEEEETILDIYEPYLIQLGFLKRTPRGRVVTRSAFEHLSITPPPTLFSA
jgi:Holliday junction DNA helicase RuvB